MPISGSVREFGTAIFGPKVLNPPEHPSPHLAYIGYAMPVPEKALIALIRRMGNPSKSGRIRGLNLLLGIGDDCAVLRPRTGHDLLVTTDFSLEGIHFRRDWHPPESAGHRCL